MKWIGQHIWDFISRFRSDVYLEATESGTIASGGNLGLDSNNKIVKATGVSSSTLASTVTVTDSTANTYFPIVFHNESNGLLDDTGAFKYNPSLADLALVASGNGSFSLYETADTANDIHVNFYNTKGGAAGDDNDNLGTFSFYGKNDAGSPQTIQYGSFTAAIADASDSDEAGVMVLKVATEGTERQVLTGTGDGASSKVDVGIGYGNTSTTTIAGTLTMGSTAAMTNAGLLSVANQSNITGLGTVTSGTWQATDVGIAYGGTGQSTAQAALNALAGATNDGKYLRGNGSNVQMSSIQASDVPTSLPAITSVGTLTNLQVDFINTNASTLTITDSSDTGDLFSIATTTHGATTITTVDDDGKNGDLTFAADGDSIFNIGDADQEKLFKINIPGATTHMLEVAGEVGNYSKLKMYEAGGDTTDDSFAINVFNDGQTMLTTVDGGGASAHFEIQADGDIILDSAGQIKLEPTAGNNILLDGTIAIDAGVVTGATSIATTQIELGHASDTTITRTAAGKIAVEGVGVALVSNTARQVVSLRTDDQYVIYLGSVNRWYQANRVFSSIGTQSTLDGASVTDSIAITAASYIAIRPCTVHSVIVSWYPSQSSAIEFEILKVPLVDNSTSNVTFAQMTHTDHNASYTANTNYVKTFAITGGNTLTAGQGIALAARRTSGNATYFNAGQIYAEIEITG